MSQESEQRDAQRAPLSGEIISVTGRRTAGGGRGLPAVDNVVIRDEDGRERRFGMPHGGVERSMRVLTPIFAQSFSVCPICLTDGPRDREHVPQGSLGGVVMTTTCGACNNGLGSSVEAELQDWFDKALVNVAFEHEDVQGRRRAGRVFYRRGPDGFYLLPEGDLAPEIVEMLKPGSFQLHFREPQPARYKLAALKHAYLAACLYLGYVPNIPEAEEIRADLLAARDAGKRGPIPRSHHAERLELHRSHRPPQGPPLAVVQTIPLDADEGPEEYISLAGTVFVSWPFSSVPPRRRYQVVPMFE